MASLDPELSDLAERTVAEAARRGASAAECVVSTGRALSVAVRLGQTESIHQSEGRSLGIRVFRGRRAGVTHSSDLAWSAVERMLDAALAIAGSASEDPFAGLPDPGELGQLDADLRLYSPAAAEVTPDAALALALRAERAALDADPRLTNSDGASFDAGEGVKILANSLGFLGAVRRSSCSLSAVPIASDGGAQSGDTRKSMQRDYWYTVGRSPEELESPEAVGRTAAERTLRRLGARKVPTARVPVVFDPQTARSLLGHVLEAASGDAVYRQSSFLAGRLGQQVAADSITLFDDGTLPGRLGSAPFDAEGVPTRRTAIIGRGNLNSYLLNCYAARKLSLSTTGNAGRALAGPPGVSCHNLWLEPGPQSPREIIASVSNGLYVTEFIGFGVNPVTGDYSRGATGLWIENGELTYPVEEITVAGNLNAMLRQVAAVGNDLVFRGAVNSPTLLIEGLTVAGS